MVERTVGIVGGVGPESTADYYRRFIDRWRVRGPADTYPAVLLNSLNSRAALGAMLNGDIEPTVTLFSRAVDQLAAGGAGLAMVASVMMHMAYSRVAATAPIPMLSILDALVDGAKARGLGRLGVLGARPTVEGDLGLSGQSAAGDLVTLALLPGAAVTPPPGIPARRVPDELSWEGLLEEIFEADQVIAW